MTSAAAASSIIAAPQIRPAGRWISRAAAATVAGLTAIAGAINYSHMRRSLRNMARPAGHASGELTGRIPSILSLAQQHALSNRTAAHALTTVRDEGVIVSVRGKGYYVATRN